MVVKTPSVQYAKLRKRRAGGLETPNSLVVTVQFTEGLSTVGAVTKIAELPNPQIITWYIGSYGLRKAGVEFYRDHLIKPTFQQNPEATYWLVDLTAWAAFKNPSGSIDKTHGACSVLGTLDRRVKSISSARIFEKMLETSEHTIIEYFKIALRRKFICNPSSKFPDKKILVREILPSGCPIMADWYNCDVSKAYSIFQYFEGCLLVEEIFTHRAATGKRNIQIVFALPNDELKYYKDRACSFQKDVHFLISKRCNDLNITNAQLCIDFLAFTYSTSSKHRPYNAPGKTLQARDMTYADVIGNISDMETLTCNQTY